MSEEAAGTRVLAAAAEPGQSIQTGWGSPPRGWGSPSSEPAHQELRDTGLMENLPSMVRAVYWHSLTLAVSSRKWRQSTWEIRLCAGGEASTSHKHWGMRCSPAWGGHRDKGPNLLADASKERLNHPGQVPHRETFAVHWHNPSSVIFHYGYVFETKHIKASLLLSS